MNTGPILLVEDDPNDQLLIKRAFSRARLSNEIVVADDGDAAVAYLQSPTAPRPALVLLDIKLPRRSGLEVLEWLRGEPNLRRLPVVMLTSSEESRDVARAYDLGANSYLTKPVDFEKLIQMVQVLGLYWTVWNQPPPG
jgi:CheY-like chemotaxis protein